MKYVRVPKEKASIIKELNKVMDKKRKIFSDENFVFVPVSENKIDIEISKVLEDSGSEIVSEEELSPELKKSAKASNKGNSLKDLLKEYFSDEEIERIKTSYDIVGDIAIIEIDDEFLDKKEIIGNAILKANPHVKTVIKKKGKHEGIFRVQKYDYVCGENKFETIHKENGVLLKLKVDETYFSVRMGSERKRIINQIKEKEDVLVMFSGIGPYPIEIAKNTKARVVYGIELNPNAHKYSIINRFLNKAWNFLPILGDVKEVSKSFYSYSFGIKSSINPTELKNKLENNVNNNFSVIELYLTHEDLTENDDEIHNLNNLLKTIDDLKEKGKNVFLHIPMPLKFEPLEGYLNELRILGKIAKEKQCQIIVHLPPEKVVKENEKLRIVLDKFSDYFYQENQIKDEFLRTFDGFNKFKDLIKNVCVDVSHLGLVLKDTEKVKAEIKKFSENFNCYFHLNNYLNNTDSVELYKGALDIKEFLDLLTFGVVEVRNSDELISKEIIDSFRWLSNHKKEFDRILMPLPKGGEHFLDDALSLIKDKGIVHFYDFLHETDFDLAIEKIKEACKRNSMDFKVLNFVKCGQHSPKTYRICVDFQVFKK